MKSIYLLTIATICTIFSVSSNAQGKPKVIKPAEISWTHCDPKTPSDPCQIYYFLGNPEKQPNHSYFRVLNGYVFPPHWHTGNSHLVVIKGEFVVGAENDPKGMSLRPGEFMYEPAKWIHWGKCAADECVVYLCVDGPDSFIDVKERRP